MKFGKYVGYNQNPDWSPFMVNYRSLEKSILRVKKHRDALSANDRNKEQDSLLNKTDLFRILLDAELNKVNKFFVEEESKIVADFEEVLKDMDKKKEEWDRTKREYSSFINPENMNYLRRIRDQSTRRNAEQLKLLYGKIDSLQNFASLNYNAIRVLLGMLHLSLLFNPNVF
jgi:hypothetical protein